ncbi:hypothetical protein BC937DRAFT_88626, partial [Endogone sp. FLAS-F59071]
AVIAGLLNKRKSTLGITHILSIGNFSARFPDDDESVDIMRIFPETNQFIEDVLNGSKGKVFVHWRALAIRENEVKHTRGRSFRRIIVDKSEDQLCHSDSYHYIPPLRWMVGLEKKPSGPLECPRCNTTIGNYRWVGMTCSPCRQIILPGFALLKTNVIEGGWEKR